MPEDNRLAQPLDAVVDAADLGAWRPLVDAWRSAAAGRALALAVDARVAAGAHVYPARVLRALELTPPESVRVVILGQDPYHGLGQAEGLAFSVAPGLAFPPSLRNMFRERARDLQLPVPAQGSLQAWARRGVLLLNTVLTVERERPGSHAGLGWEALTQGLLDALAADAAPKVFMLWGRHAQALAPRLQRGPHGVLQANHPSPLSATRGPKPFLGCGHFGRAAQFLRQAGRGELDWGLDA